MSASCSQNSTRFLGVPGYRKVLTVAAGPNNSTVNTAHGITSPVRFVGVKVMLKSGSTHLCFGGGGHFSGYAGYMELLYTLAWFRAR